MQKKITDEGGHSICCAPFVIPMVWYDSVTTLECRLRKVENEISRYVKIMICLSNKGHLKLETHTSSVPTPQRRRLSVKGTRNYTCPSLNDVSVIVSLQLVMVIIE